MKFVRALLKTLRRKELDPKTYEVIISEAVLTAIARELRPDTTQHHEGIVYLLGRTNGSVTVVIAASRPEATNTRGSFNVTAVAMARTVRAAADIGLQVVGQLHTHPGQAFHSDGDVAGARIRYPGYVSIVVPNYGTGLPGLRGSAFYFCRADRRFTELGVGDVLTVPVTV